MDISNIYRLTAVRISSVCFSLVVFLLLVYLSLSSLVYSPILSICSSAFNRVFVVNLSVFYLLSFVNTICCLFVISLPVVCLLSVCCFHFVRTQNLSIRLPVICQSSVLRYLHFVVYLSSFVACLFIVLFSFDCFQPFILRFLFVYLSLYVCSLWIYLCSPFCLSSIVHRLSSIFCLCI